MGNPIGSEEFEGGSISWVNPELDDALIEAYSVLALLNEKGLINTNWNKRSVREALDKIAPFAQAAQKRARNRDD